jgi:hypothetical protein
LELVPESSAESTIPSRLPRKEEQQMNKNYFFGASLVILVCSLIAFSDNLITDVGQPSNSDPKFIIHGLFCLAWVCTLVAQTWLIRRRSFSVHKTIGAWAMFVALGVVVSTEYLYVLKFESWGETATIVRVNMIFIPSFAALVVLGYLNRKTPALHKRSMYLATLYMLLPILDRVGGNTGISSYLTIPIIWNGMFLSFFAYDWVIARKINRITYLGYIWFWTVWAIAILT